MSSPTGRDANRSRLPGTYGQAGHRYPSSLYPEKQGGGAPTLRTPRDLGDEDKGCHRLAGDRQQAKLLSHMQPLVPRRTEVPDYEVEVENGSGPECPHLMMGILALPGAAGDAGQVAPQPSSALGEHTHCCGWVVLSPRPRREIVRPPLLGQVAVKTHLQGSSR